jgi:hypothetical protein
VWFCKWYGVSGGVVWWVGAVRCCAVLCCAVLCCAVLCCAVLCCAVLCCAVLCCAGGTLIDFGVVYGIGNFESMCGHTSSKGFEGCRF